MSYLKVRFNAPVNGASFVIIPKDNISYVQRGAAGNSVDVVLKQAVVGAGGDSIRLQFTAAAAAGYSLEDAVLNGWIASPGNGVSEVSGIPATLSASGQALTFSQCSGYTLV